MIIQKKNIQNYDNFYYDAEISPTIFKNNFFDEIKKIEPFGTGNPLPTFLFKELKVIKSKILNKWFEDLFTWLNQCEAIFSKNEL